jgi:hypothetical protein
MSLLYFLMLMVMFIGISRLMENRAYGELPARRRARRLKRRRDDEDRDEIDEEETDKTSRRSAKRRRGRKGKREKTREETRDVQNIWVGDVISVAHIDRDFVVTKHMTMNENSWSWDEYTLVDGDDEFSLSVAEEGTEIYLSHPIDIEVAFPPPETIEYDDKTFTLTDSGRAESKENTLEETHRFRYYAYQGPDEFALTIEDWEGELEIYLGEQIHSRDLHILPGQEENAV